MVLFLAWWAIRIWCNLFISLSRKGRPDGKNIYISKYIHIPRFTQWLNACFGYSNLWCRENTTHAVDIYRWLGTAQIQIILTRNFKCDKENILRKYPENKTKWNIYLNSVFEQVFVLPAHSYTSKYGIFHNEKYQVASIHRPTNEWMSMINSFIITHVATD